MHENDTKAEAKFTKANKTNGTMLMRVVFVVKIQL
jgi:hypothetical protein